MLSSCVKGKSISLIYVQRGSHLWLFNHPELGRVVILLIASLAVHSKVSHLVHIEIYRFYTM